MLVELTNCTADFLLFLFC